jgi:LytS/YehU family sensor histidine kinase
MDTTLLTPLIMRLQIMYVIIVVAYLLMRNRIFSEIPGGQPAFKDRNPMIVRGM